MYLHDTFTKNIFSVLYCYVDMIDFLYPIFQKHTSRHEINDIFTWYFINFLI